MASDDDLVEILPQVDDEVDLSALPSEIKREIEDPAGDLGAGKECCRSLDSFKSFLNESCKFLE